LTFLVTESLRSVASVALHYSHSPPLLLLGIQQHWTNSTRLVYLVHLMTARLVNGWSCQYQKPGKHRWPSRATRLARGRI